MLTGLLQDLKLNFLLSKINETESAMEEIETAASKHLQGLAMQSEQALEGAQKKLLLASEKVEEFTIFVKVWILCTLPPGALLQAQWAVAYFRWSGVFWKFLSAFPNHKASSCTLPTTLFKFSLCKIHFHSLSLKMSTMFLIFFFQCQFSYETGVIT